MDHVAPPAVKGVAPAASMVQSAVGYGIVEDRLEAESTGSHCGGTALGSDRRAWAVELGADEILRLMVLLTVAARTRPCAPVGRRREQGGAYEG